MTSSIDVAVLGLLSEAEQHGYELKKRLGDLAGWRASVSFGSLYPALGRLERQGLVKAVEERTTVPSAPMSGSLAGELAAFRSRVRANPLGRSGRSRKVYGITDLGRERLAEALRSPEVGDDRDFALRVGFAAQLEPAERLALFEARRGELARRAAQRRRADTAHDDGARRPIDRYRRALAERDLDALTTDLTWLDGLIAAERTLMEENR